MTATPTRTHAPTPHTRPTPHDPADDAERVPAWVAYGGVFIVGGTALLVLAYYQHTLGLRAHMPWVLSWSFSVGLDVGSAVSGIFWFFGGGKVRAWGRAFSIALVLTSTALTCVAWGLEAGRQWAMLGVVHPLVVFGMAKLLTVWQAARAHGRVARQVLAEQLHTAETALRAARDAVTRAAAETAAAVEARDTAETAAREAWEQAHAAEARAHAATPTPDPTPLPAADPTPGRGTREAVDRAILTAWGRGVDPTAPDVVAAAGRDAAYVRDRKRALRKVGHDVGNVPAEYRLRAV